MLGLPDPGQRLLGVGVEGPLGPAGDEVADDGGKDPDVGQGEVETLGSGGRTVCATPSVSVNRSTGRSLVRPSTAVSLTPKRTSPPSRDRAAARSTNTSSADRARPTNRPAPEVFLQGDTRHAGNASDGVIARRQIAQVLIGSLSSPAAVSTTFELVAERGPAQTELEPLFAALDRDDPGSLDGVRDASNQPLEQEPQRVLDDLERLRR